MNTKTINRVLSLLLVVIISAGAAIVGGVSANAATVLKVQISKVNRLYSEAKSFLDKINDYREANGKPALIMDSVYLENAMIRAAEVALYDSDTSPNGSSGLRLVTEGSDKAQIRGCDVLSFNELLTRMKANGESNSYLLKTNFKSAGIGIVKINGYQFVSVLLSDKTPIQVKESVLQQDSVVQDQVVEALPSVLTNVSSPYPDNYQIYCGSAFDPKMKIVNKTYPYVYVYLNPYNAEVSLTDESVLKYNGSKAVAIKPGYCTVKVYFASAPSINCQTTVRAIGQSFSECDFDSIPDQTYTGSPIQPSVRIKNSDGQYMKLGTDYSVTYENNINVGVATAHITGLGSYTGENKDIRFNIVYAGGQGGYFSVSLSTASPEIALGQSVKLSTKVTGGQSPYTYTFSYAPYGTSSWTTIASSGKSYTMFTPKEAKAYYVRVTVKDSSSRSASSSAMVTAKDPFSVTVYATPRETSIGNTVKIKASAKGGVNPINYAFLVRKPGGKTWISLQTYSTNDTIAYKPKKEGVYTFYIKCKSGTGEYISKFLNVKVVASTLVNHSSVAPKNVDYGGAVQLKGAASGGKTPYTYTYMAKKSTWTNWYTLKNNVKDTIYTYRPSASGDYNICIKVKDAAGLELMKYFDIKVYDKLTNSSKLSTAKTTPGSTVTVTGAASGGKASYQYAFYYKHSSAAGFTQLKAFSAAKTASFSPTLAGTYTVRTKVKDSTGNIVVKDLTLTAYTTLKNTSTLSAGSIASGKTITIKCGASGGTSPYTYSICYKKPGVTIFSTPTSYAAISQKSLVLSTKGVFTIRVFVKDKNGVIISKDMKVTVT